MRWPVTQLIRSDAIAATAAPMSSGSGDALPNRPARSGRKPDGRPATYSVKPVGR